jgi:hypothetical protein
MPGYDALKDDDDIHEADITVGMDLRGSVVVRVRHEVKESEDRYKLKKFILLLNGIEIISTYINSVLSWSSRFGQSLFGTYG